MQLSDSIKNSANYVYSVYVQPLFPRVCSSFSLDAPFSQFSQSQKLVKEWLLDKLDFQFDSQWKREPVHRVGRFSHLRPVTFPGLFCIVLSVVYMSFPRERNASNNFYFTGGPIISSHEFLDVEREKSFSALELFVHCQNVSRIELEVQPGWV